MSREFDAFESSFINACISSNYTPEESHKIYFEIFENHLQRTGIFWYMALFYVCPTDVLRRYYQFLIVETWNVCPNQTPPTTYDKLLEKTKDDILIDLREYVKGSNLKMLMLLNSTLNFF